MQAPGDGPDCAARKGGPSRVHATSAEAGRGGLVPRVWQALGELVQPSCPLEQSPQTIELAECVTPATCLLSPLEQSPYNVEHAMCMTPAMCLHCARMQQTMHSRLQQATDFFCV